MTMLSVVTKPRPSQRASLRSSSFTARVRRPRVWMYWQAAFVQAGWPTHNLDLRGHGASGAVDLRQVGIFDYVDDVNAVADQLTRRRSWVGWSMGGHIAVIAASRGGYAGCIAFDPDPPPDRVDESVEMAYGLRTPEEIGYTLDGDPRLLPHMPDLTTEERRIAQSSLCDESRLMGSQRRRGILIERMPCPMLEILGGLDDYYPTEPSYHGVGLAGDQCSLPSLHIGGLYSAVACKQSCCLRCLLAEHERVTGACRSRLTDAVLIPSVGMHLRLIRPVLPPSTAS